MREEASGIESASDLCMKSEFLAVVLGYCMDMGRMGLEHLDNGLLDGPC